MKKATENNPFHPRHYGSIQSTKKVGISREVRTKGSVNTEVPQGHIDWSDPQEEPVEIEVEISFAQLVGIFLILSALYDLFSSLN